MTIKGIFAVFFGLVALFAPGAGLAALMEYFGILVMVAGLLMVVGGFSQMRYNKRWANWFFEGMIDLVTGAVILMYPELSIDVFVIIVGIWAVAVGCIQLYVALSAHKGGRTRWLLLVNALIVIIFAAVLFVNLLEDEESLKKLIGMFALIYGGFIAAYSINLKNCL